MRRSIALLTTLGLAAGLLASAATSAAADEPGPGFELRGTPPAAARAGAAEQLVSATATFSTRAPGMPRAGARPDQTILPGAVLEVSYGYHWDTGVLEYTFDARPTSGGLRADDQPADVVGVGLGVFDAAKTCQVDTADLDDVSRFSPERLVYGSGDATGTPRAGLWDCAAVFVRSADGSITYDAYVSPLTVTTAAPVLTLEAPRKDRLVMGVWTRVPVTVTNSAPEEISARDVVVAGKGKGVKVRSAKLGEIAGQEDSDGYVWVKLTKPRSTVRLTVSDVGEQLDATSVKVRRRPAPAAPQAGRWSNKDVSFTVRGGKVRGFAINTQTTCGGYPDLPTTTNSNYSFQTVKIPRNNEVVGTERGNQGGDAAYSAYLDLEFVSRTKVKGKFSYYGPARCTAFAGFTAKVKR